MKYISLYLLLACGLHAAAADNNQNLVDAQDHVQLSTILLPIKNLRMNQNGMVFQSLECMISPVKENGVDYIEVDSTTQESSEFTITNNPRKLIWIHDPCTQERMPTLLHRATQTEVTTNLFFDRPTNGVLDYEVVGLNAENISSFSVDCIVYPNNCTYRECRIVCKKPVLPDRYINNPTFTAIQALGLQVSRLIGQCALLSLCTNLPHLTNLCVSHTQLDDEELILVHPKLLNCEISSCNITKLGHIQLPRLRTFTLNDNKLTSFDVRLFGHQPCAIFLKNNNISTLHNNTLHNNSSKKTIPPIMLDLRGNPLDMVSAHTSLFGEDVNSERNLQAPLFLSHNQFRFYKDGYIAKAQE